jgi:transaldolase
LHAGAGWPNLFIKIRGNREGLPAKEEATLAGLRVKWTPMFSRAHGLAAADGCELLTASGANAA